MICPLLSVIAALAAASPLSHEMLTKRALENVPAGWELKAAAPASLAINMHIVLKERNMDKLQQRLLETSDPDHADYGKHMSKAEVEAMTAPSSSSVRSVMSWLASYGIYAGEVSSGFISVTMTVV